MWAGAWLELDPELRRLRRWKVTTAGFCGVHGHGAVACTPPIASSHVSCRRDHIHTWWALLQDEAEARAGSSAREEVALAWVSEITQRTEQAAGSGGGGGSGGTTVVASSQGSRHVSIRFHSGGDVAAAAASSSAAWQLLFPKKRMARDFVQLVGWCSSAPVQEAAAAVAAAGGGQAWARAAAEARCELEAQATETPGKVLGHVEVNIVDQDGWRSERVPLHEHRRCIYNVKQVRHCISNCHDDYDFKSPRCCCCGCGRDPRPPPHPSATDPPLATTHRFALAWRVHDATRLSVALCACRLYGGCLRHPARNVAEVPTMTSLVHLPPVIQASIRALATRR
jgi:hypothetical protein